ncbi:hypothetical protein [Pseudoalteromonas denitrificans]|jgi:hypothetical protein|uniref:Uncharacterized protein n=1 Tax=Pseudoalteromonas denitrificans DSM 6059 TaxID=1123010 RepID=A0A1I1LV53_9GAMM|nr:hypothetical protein [Pseudoalteromonas denitrificans]SFC76352.1 hypothetical protein SAMN02745724_02502 [Pseudoalteromonas denitrificans DSM 6059]
MKIILGIVILSALVFLFAPQEVYRIIDLINSDAQKFKPTVLGRLVFSDKNEVQHNFTLKRSGYYELGVLLNDSRIRIDSIEKQFNGEVLLEIYSKDKDLVFAENITKPKYFKPIDGNIDFAKKVALITVSLNTFKDGKNYYAKIKIPSRNDFLTSNVGELYFNLSGYY